jgi:hypothetical protein
VLESVQCTSVCLGDRSGLVTLKVYSKVGGEGHWPPAACGRAGGERRTAPSGSLGWWAVAREGGYGRGPQGAGILGAWPLPASTREGCCHSAGRALGWPRGLRKGSAAVDTHAARPEEPPCRPRASGNRFCCCVILYQPLLSMLPAAASFLRPFVWALLGVCPFPSRSPPAKCHNVPEVHGGRERAGT